MTEKAKDDLTKELMLRYGIKTDDDKVEFKPPKPPSEAAASDPFYSSPSPIESAGTIINPFINLKGLLLGCLNTLKGASISSAFS